MAAGPLMGEGRWRYVRAMNDPVPLEQAIDEAMVQILSPEGGREYLEAVQKRSRLVAAARAKVQELLCRAQTRAETSLALWHGEAEIEQARTAFLNDIRRVMERECGRIAARERPEFGSEL